MSRGDDWFTIHKAVDQQTCAKAAEEILATDAEEQKEGFLEYKPTPICFQIANVVHKTYGDQVDSIKAGARPVSVSVSKFTKLARAAARFHGKEGDAYLVVAITQLSEETGMFALYGRHEQDPTIEKEEVPVLPAGDVVVWTGSTRGRNSTSEGGISIIVVYR